MKHELVWYDIFFKLRTVGVFVGPAVGTITHLSDTGEVCGHVLYPTCLSARHLELLATAYPSMEGPVSLMSVAQTTFPLGLILTHSSDSVLAF